MVGNSPITLGGVLIKNRIVFPPLTTNWADKEGRVTTRLLNFYKKIANGNCGTIVVSGTAVIPEGKATDRALCLHDGKNLSGFENLAKEIRKRECFASIQLMHVGGQGNPEFTGHIPVAPSNYACKATGYVARELSEKDITILRAKFIHSAVMAAEAGFQAIELHLAHGYMLHEFLSAYTNKRKNAYGGNLKNRARLILEIIAGISEKVPNLIIGARISGEDYVEGGINEDVNRELLPILEKAGIQYFSITAGIYDTSKLKNEAMQRGDFFKYARVIKTIINQPVIGVGKILDLESAEQHLLNGDCDMVAIGRALVADPMMLLKVKKGQPYKRCTECDECHFLRKRKKELVCPLWEEEYA